MTTTTETTEFPILTIREFAARCAKGTAVILRGAPGAGKSSLVQALAEYGFVEHCSADNYRMVAGQYVFDPTKNDTVHQACFRQFVEAARVARSNDDNVDFLVCDNTNTTLGEIAPYHAAASAYGWRALIVTVKADPEVAAARNLHHVPADKVRHMAARLEDSAKYFPRHWATAVVAGQ